MKFWCVYRSVSEPSDKPTEERNATMEHENLTVTRINLKTNCADRNELVAFCLRGEKQYLAIGWSYVYATEEQKVKIHTYQDYYKAVRSSVKEIKSRIERVLGCEKRRSVLDKGSEWELLDLQGCRGSTALL